MKKGFLDIQQIALVSLVLEQTVLRERDKKLKQFFQM